MTPNELALLLAVAKRVPGSSYLDRLIAAVEAEAALAEDEAELAEVAEKARACEADVCTTCIRTEKENDHD